MYVIIGRIAKLCHIVGQNSNLVMMILQRAIQFYFFCTIFMIALKKQELKRATNIFYVLFYRYVDDSTDLTYMALIGEVI